MERTKIPFDGCKLNALWLFDEWLLLGLRMGHALPVVDGIHLIPAEAA